MTNSTKIFHARTPADVLAAIPYILGFAPERSFVALSLRGGTLGATVRVDLPGRMLAAGTVKQWARQVAETLRSDQLAEGSILAIYADEDWDGAGICDGDALLVELHSAFTTVGMPPSAVWWIGPTTVRDCLCCDPLCSDYAGFPRSQIEQSAVSAEMVYSGRSYRASTEVAQCGVFPDTALDALLTAFTIKAPQELAPEQAPVSENANQMLRSYLGAWELVLSGNGGELTPQRIAELITLLGRSETRDGVMVSAVTSLERAAAALEPGSEGGSDYYQRLCTLFLGDFECWRAERVEEEGESVRNNARVTIPQWQRMDNLERCLSVVGALVARENAMQRPLPVPSKRPFAAALCILAWIAWCRGRGTASDAHLRVALSVAPGYQLAQLLRQLLNTGLVCSWAKNPQTAWHPSAV